MENTIDTSNEITGKKSWEIVSKIKDDISATILYCGIKFIALFLIWIIYVNYNYSQPQVFFINTVVYVGGFLLDIPKEIFFKKNKVNFLTILAIIMFIIFLLTSFLGVIEILKVNPETENICLYFLGGKRELIEYKLYITLTGLMPVVSTFKYFIGSKKNGGEEKNDK